MRAPADLGPQEAWGADPRPPGIREPGTPCHAGEARCLEGWTSCLAPSLVALAVEESLDPMGELVPGAACILLASARIRIGRRRAFQGQAEKHFAISSQQMVRRIQGGLYNYRPSRGAKVPALASGPTATDVRGGCGAVAASRSQSRPVGTDLMPENGSTAARPVSWTYARRGSTR